MRDVEPSETTLPPPPPARPRAPQTFGMRPVAVGAACGLVAAVASVLADRGLQPYPPRYAVELLSGMTIVSFAAGLAAGFVRDDGWRARLVIAALAASAVIPPLASRTVPGIAQPAEHPIPGGETRVVCAAPDGNWDLYLLVDGDASKLVALTDTPDRTECSGHLSPDGTAVAYAMWSGPSELSLLRLDDAGRVTSNVALLPGDDRTMWPTAWTPDGDLLVVIETETGSRVDRYDLDTGWTDAAPAWSPDGATLSFTSWVNGSGDVWIARADGSARRDLTASSPDADTGATWTSDGHLVFFSNRSHTGGTFLYVMNADGSDVRLALRI